MNLRQWGGAIKSWFANGLWKKLVTKFPGKTTLNLKTLGTLGGTTLLSAAILFSFFSSPDDTSQLSRSSESIKERITETLEPAKPKENVKGVASDPPAESQGERKKAAPIAKLSNLNYRAKQVIERQDVADPYNTLPTGTNFIGRLLTSIDTREAASLSKIELPYGGAFQGNELLAKGSVVLASAKYDGNGEKVFLDIHSGVYPDGQEFKLKAQALSGKDFSPGIEGDYHGTFSSRVASNLGLSFISGLTDVLTEKQNLGNGTFLTPKPTLQNGVLFGVSKVTEMEAQRMAKEWGSKQPYVTVDAGKELIVSLLERFVKGK